MILLFDFEFKVQMLPNELINKIFMFISSPTAWHIQRHFHKKRFGESELLIDSYGLSFRKIYLHQMIKRTDVLPFTFIRFLHYRMGYETVDECMEKLIDFTCDERELWEYYPYQYYDVKTIYLKTTGRFA